MFQIYPLPLLFLVLSYGNRDWTASVAILSSRGVIKLQGTSLRPLAGEGRRVTVVYELTGRVCVWSQAATRLHSER